jgi:heterotetrameric sarcosine oxidase delta subunit
VTRLACPFCGPRDLAEFSFHKTLPEPGTNGFAAIYERRASTERSLEHWQHVGGCRAWLRVLRNPSTGEVLDCRLEAGGDP